MDDVKREIAEIRTRWAEEDAESKRRAAAAQLENLRNRRQALRDGIFRPDCACDSCMQAVIMLQPDVVCEVGRKKGRWW